VRSFIVASALCALLGASAQARAEEEETAVAKKKVPWRGSLFTYEHSFNAISINKGHDPYWNPYYAQTLDFKPRFYPTENLYLAARLILEIELTQSDETNHAREWTVSDLTLDVGYSNKKLTIPVVGIDFKPSVRFTFPTSIVSRNRSLVTGIGPSVALSRELKLLKGNVLSSLELTYAFRPTKNFQKYAYAQVDIADLYCANVSRPECQHQGKRNVSWRFSNYFGAKLQILKKLSLGADLFIFNDLLYKIPPQSYEDVLKNESYSGSGASLAVDESRINHRALLWAIFDISYDVLDWLTLSVGTSTYHAELAPDSTYYAPFFNRFTNFYFDVTIPIDAFVEQIQSWAGRGRRAAVAKSAAASGSN
jgi:hypothetical protein